MLFFFSANRTANNSDVNDTTNDTGVPTTDTIKSDHTNDGKDEVAAISTAIKINAPTTLKRGPNANVEIRSAFGSAIKGIVL